MADPPDRRWPAIELRPTPPDDHGAPSPTFEEQLAAAVDGLGATAIDQPDPHVYRVFFPDAATRRDAAQALAVELRGRWALALIDVEDEGWLQKVQSTLGAVRVGRFVVAPPWDRADIQADDALTIVIEPSMGFGTGHHESTRLCLEALGGLSLEGRRVIDVGTGSGVLAIAAAKLGAAQVAAFDLDPDAVASALDNVHANDVEQVVGVSVGDLEQADVEAAEVVLANLTAAALARHSAALERLVAAGGVLVTSGFTADQQQAVVEAFPAFEVADARSEQAWCCVVFRRG